MKRTLFLLIVFLFPFFSYVNTYAVCNKDECDVFLTTNVSVHRHKADGTGGATSPNIQSYDLSLLSTSLGYDGVSLVSVGDSIYIYAAGYCHKDRYDLNRIKSALNNPSNVKQYGDYYYWWRSITCGSSKSFSVNSSVSDYVQILNAGESNLTKFHEFMESFLSDNLGACPNITEGHFSGGELVHSTTVDLEAPINLKIENLKEIDFKKKYTSCKKYEFDMTWEQSDEFNYSNVQLEMKIDGYYKWRNTVDNGWFNYSDYEATGHTGFIFNYTISEASKYYSYGSPYRFRMDDVPGYIDSIYDDFVFPEFDKKSKEVDFFMDGGLASGHAPSGVNFNPPNLMVRNRVIVDGVEHTSPWLYIRIHKDGTFSVGELTSNFTPDSNGNDPDNSQFNPNSIYDNNSLNTIVDYGADSSNLYGYISQLVNNVRSFPKFFQTMFGFLPMSVITLITISISFIVILRFLGR